MQASCQQGVMMNNLSIRGLDDKALAKLKKLAASEEASVNAVVLRLIEQGLGHKRAKPTPQRHDDLDALAGTWSKQDAKEFERVTAPFGKIETELWK
jgi:paraquat-inducible protein B